MRAPRPAMAHAAPRAAVPLLAVLAAGCAVRAARPLPPLAVTADSASTTRVADGVTLHRLWFARGPQAVQVLDVDRAACWTLLPRKAGGAAVGRAGTLALVRGLADSLGAPVAGGVNADFFLFAPPGVPTGAHVQDGRVVTGPGVRPALAIDSAGAPWVGTLRAAGRATLPDGPLGLDAWNRGSARGVALYDAGYGPRTDSLPGRLLVTVRMGDGGSGAPASVVAVDSGAIAAIAPGTVVLAAGALAEPAVRARLRALRPGDGVRVAPALAPVAPRQAIGGFPVLVRDGRVDAAVDSAGNAGFRGPNPRTAVGVAADGRRLLLVANDGRRKGRSLGMSLRELAELFVAMGARDAINLDGGGSTTLVVREPSGGFRIANQPSDSAGERPVGNALAVVRGACR